MKILFLTICHLNGIEDHGIYTDLLRCFIRGGHDVYTMSPYEKRLGKPTECVRADGATMLHVRIGNITQCGTLEKGISTLMVEELFLRGVKQYFSDVKFDLVIYSTPPITFARVIQYVKKRDNARTYLLLKDIFPQNAVDIGMLSKSGWKGLLYAYFRRKEKMLYAISDRIGCMSPANAAYVLRHNPQIPREKVEVCPNSMEVRDMALSPEERAALRKKYGIPVEKTVFVYGGNLGRPQGISNLIECLRARKDHPEAYFLIIGSGTEFDRLAAFFEQEASGNMLLMKSLPKDEYDSMIVACDVGLIFLDHRFTIPNFPSRLLSYMQAGLPVLACTDPNSDLKDVIAEGGFGWWCQSDCVESFSALVDRVCGEYDLKGMGRQGLAYLKEHYTVEKSYQIIFKEEQGATGA